MSQYKWIPVKRCNSCASDSLRLYMESHAPTWYSGHPLRLVKCNDCGLVFASPRPTYKSLYKGYVQGEAKAANLFERKRNRSNVMKVHGKVVDESIQALGRPAKSLFDMGCGAGTILLAARERGLEASGNEVNKYAVDRLCEEGFDVHFCFSEGLPPMPGRFDIVTNLDYLEHTYTPQDDLDRCWDMLKDGGVLYLKTLYLGCPDHQDLGEAWQLFGQGHFSYFDEKTLTGMLLRSCFDVLEIHRARSIITMVARKGFRL